LALYGVESRRDLDAERERRRGQGRQISAWVVVGVGDNGTIKETGVEIVNGSTAPVYDVEIQVNGRDGDPQPTLKLTVLPPGRFYSAKHPVYHWTFPKPSDEPMRPVTKKPEWRVERLSFRDSANALWARDATGMLSDQSAVEPAAW
jgi:hypothetical protein